MHPLPNLAVLPQRRQTIKAIKHEISDLLKALDPYYTTEVNMG